ncbi:hypothetical protein ACLOJK_029917 [Asimina triloba]
MMVVVVKENPRSPRIGDVDVKVLPSIAGDWLSALGKQRPTKLTTINSQYICAHQMDNGPVYLITGIKMKECTRRMARLYWTYQ